MCPRSHPINEIFSNFAKINSLLEKAADPIPDIFAVEDFEPVEYIFPLLMF